VAGLCALLSPGASPARAEGSVSVSVSERLIRITPRYHGELVRVEGTAPAECAVVVKLTAERRDASYSRKGKVGPLWLAVDQVRFGNVPLMYKVKSTAALDDLLSPEEQVRYVLGRRGLMASMTVPPGLDRDVYLSEMIRIREQDRFYGFDEGPVSRRGASFSTTFYWPPDGPSGRYLVEAFAVRQGHVQGTAETEVDVRMVGVEAWVRDLAAAHGVLYGLLAVLTAVAAGVVVSVMFTGGGRRTARTAATRPPP
jgi:uncharacterized protein (TIGR02186 family)